MNNLQLEVEARKFKIMANNQIVLDELFSVIFVNINFILNKVEIAESTNLNFGKIVKYASHDYTKGNNFFRLKNHKALMFISKNSLNRLSIKHDRLRHKLGTNNLAYW